MIGPKKGICFGKAERKKRVGEVQRKLEVGKRELGGVYVALHLSSWSQYNRE